MASEGFYCSLRESYGAPGGVLGLGEFERAGCVTVPAYPLQLAHDVERSGVEVYVRPPERQRLSLPEPAQQAQNVEGFVAVPGLAGESAGRVEELSPPAHLSLRYPMEVNLIGDAGPTLAVLLEHLDRADDRSWQNGVIEGMKSWNEVTERVAKVEADPINPRYVYHLLNERLPENSIVTADAGSTADWYGHHIKLGRDMMGNLSGRLASMLAAMPYAVSAKFAFPERPVVCTIGDGAFQMLGMNAMLTVKRHWKEWDDPRFIVLILHNNDLSQVSWEMREAGDPHYDTSQLLEDMDYAGYAELLGFTGIRVEKPGDVAGAWDAAFAADRPVVLDVLTDPNVPPLPAHISFEEVKGMMESLAKRDPAEWPVIDNSARALAAELFAKAGHALHRHES